MASIGLVGDSSLYCKSYSGSGGAKPIQGPLQDKLRQKVYFHHEAGAGATKILDMLDKCQRLQTLGVSYFGNDILSGRLPRDAKQTWQRIVAVAHEKADEVVFVVGGRSETLGA